MSSDAGWLSWEKREPAHAMMIIIFIQDPKSYSYCIIEKKTKQKKEVFTAWCTRGHTHSQLNMSFFQVNKAFRKKSWPSLIVQDEGSYLELWTPITLWRLVWLCDKCCYTIEEEKHNPKLSPSAFDRKITALMQSRWGVGDETWDNNAIYHMNCLR